MDYVWKQFEAFDWFIVVVLNLMDSSTIKTLLKDYLLSFLGFCPSL
jgi:hypothetical protein